MYQSHKIARSHLLYCLISFITVNESIHQIQKRIKNFQVKRRKLGETVYKITLETMSINASNWNEYNHFQSYINYDERSICRLQTDMWIENILENNRNRSGAVVTNGYGKLIGEKTVYWLHKLP